RNSDASIVTRTANQHTTSHHTSEPLNTIRWTVECAAALPIPATSAAVWLARASVQPDSRKLAVMLSSRPLFICSSLHGSIPRAARAELNPVGSAAAAL